jgi:hypothetical protein
LTAQSFVSGHEKSAPRFTDWWDAADFNLVTTELPQRKDKEILMGSYKISGMAFHCSRA